MLLHQQRLAIPTRGAGLKNITQQLQACVAQSGVEDGLCNVFIQHTSASLVIQENASPDVQEDLLEWMGDLAPESRPWKHRDEGVDDMPAHAKSAITRTQETIPVVGGKLALGTWQGVFVWEHRAAPQTRSVVVTVMGNGKAR